MRDVVLSLLMLAILASTADAKPRPKVSDMSLARPIADAKRCKKDPTD